VRNGKGGEMRGRGKERERNKEGLNPPKVWGGFTSVGLYNAYSPKFSNQQKIATVC